MKNALRFLNKNNSKIKTGLYRHYKEKLYFVEGSAFHSETLEDLVVYQAMYKSEEFGDFATWIRPLSSFLEKIEVDGKEVLRFVSLGDEETIKYEQEILRLSGKIL